MGPISKGREGRGGEGKGTEREGRGGGEEGKGKKRGRKCSVPPPTFE